MSVLLSKFAKIWIVCTAKQINKKAGRGGAWFLLLCLSLQGVLFISLTSQPSLASLAALGVTYPIQ